MILDALENSDRYVGCHPLFEKAFAFLKSIEEVDVLDDRTEIDGEDLFAVKVSDVGRGKADSPLETHRNYIDIQYAVTGEDCIGWSPLSSEMDSLGYDVEKDLELYNGAPDQWIRHQQGAIAIFFPEDVHAPMGTEKQVTKIVIKVKI